MENQSLQAEISLLLKPEERRRVFELFLRHCGDYPDYVPTREILIFPEPTIEINEQETQQEIDEIQERVQNSENDLDRLNSEIDELEQLLELFPEAEVEKNE